MKIREIMSRHVECISPSTPISKAAEKMLDDDIGFLPVCEHDKVVGTVTDRDITIRSVAQGRDPRLAPVSEIMTSTVFNCYEDDDVAIVARAMQEEDVRRMLIFDRDEHLVGVVSLGDIAKISGEQELAGETLGDITEAA
ncbi:MAG TPA: CBS domain-containing protein [Terriglobia bacterium]|jgi:CBS domain-containing protein|nr:CBS domain-containing protein [Terriglobia bacterium]